MKKVAIWGSYNYGNYGDDLMAILFAKALLEMGVSPVVYRLHPSLATKYGIGTTDNLNELIEGACFSMIGGGSWLEKRKLGEAYEVDFKAYRETIEAHNCPSYALSIGGDLSGDMSQLEPERMALFRCEQFKGASVRLQIDIEGLRAWGKECEYHPDVVLSLPRYFPVTPASTSGGPRVGLNLHVKDQKITRYVNTLFSRLYPGTQYYYIQTHLPHFNNTYEYVLPKDRKNISNYAYTDMEAFVQFVASLDIMITSKLHPGVTAVAYGKPFLLIEGYNKTVAFLKSIEAEGANLRRRDIIRLLARNRFSQLHDLYNPQKLKAEQAASEGHYEYLKKLVARHA